ncbi:MAG: hypothetical protein A3G29_00510 [Burkholderiales bacterium RIFCSPLOWO2_12_FULL_64_99]|nr:MAG: hypothetical protein A3E52_01375 [Burkholderiales bacterium RIFCSPHIGHO2_12_FULL_63_20]OGB67501.1 MAG: hypothetical protein A3G29_00510 [Burkholderiales bacterium RIFCSPLOWO2_12_FULL_64_99]
MLTLFGHSSPPGPPTVWMVGVTNLWKRGTYARNIVTKISGRWRVLVRLEELHDIAVFALFQGQIVIVQLFVVAGTIEEQANMHLPAATRLAVLRLDAG